MFSLDDSALQVLQKRLRRLPQVLFHQAMFLRIIV